MWTLRGVPASPFVRKARIAADVCGLTDRVEVEAADTNDANDTLRRQNPLGKIPALVLDDGTVLYDFTVIVEFFDDRAGGGVIIPRGDARFPVLALQSLADGLMDAAVLQVYEGRYREPETHSQRWLDHQKGKVTRALASLEATPPKLAAKPDAGAIAVACALGYLDFRFSGKWREGHPRLVAWLDDFAAKVPSFETTRPN